MDIKDFKENFSARQSLFIFEKDNKIPAAIYGNFGKQGESPKSASNEQLAAINLDFQNNNLDPLLKDYCKVFIVKQSVFDSIDYIQVGDTNLTKQQVFELIDSENTIEDYITLNFKQQLTDSQKQNLKKSIMEQENITDDTGFKGVLFSMMISSVMEKQGSLFFMKNLQNSNIKVYKETLIFKILNLIPESMLSQFVQSG
jgi:hypothetical protein